MTTFDEDDLLGKGTYGCVYKRLWKNTLVACKTTKLDDTSQSIGMDVTCLREVQILQSLQGHEHIVRLLEVVWQRRCVEMLMELIDDTLRTVIIALKQDDLNLSAVKSLVMQTLRGVQHCHQHGVMHRDLKPENILVDSSRGAYRVKLADFGLSRWTAHTPNPNVNGPHTPDMVTRWYRAVEIVLHNDYDQSIDMWSVGCILYELLTRRVLFKAEEDTELGYLIHETLSVDSHGDTYFKNGCAELAAASKHGQALVLGMISMKPNRRISADQALTHVFFQS